MNLKFLCLSLFLYAPLYAQTEVRTAPNEFVFNNGFEPQTLDPHAASGVYANAIIIQMFEGLMARAANWEDLVPGQAERYELSKDKKTYTFHLRKNLKWSDGSLLTAEDFLYSWLRAMRPETLNSLSYWLTDNIVGAKAYAENPNAKTQEAVGLRAIDRYTFEVRLNHPLAYFLQLTALAALFPVKKSVIEVHGDQWFRPGNIISNGPYVLKDWRVNDRIILEKNPHYYDTNSVKLDKVVALAIQDRQVAVNMFEQGSLDWTGLNGAPNALVHAYKEKPGFRTSPGFVAYFYRFNTTRKPLDDKRVRQALSLAINRNDIVEKISRAEERPAAHFVPAGIGRYKSPSGIVSGNYEQDLKKAQMLLAKAGFPKGEGFRKIRINYNTEENNKRVALAIQHMWKEGLGIETELHNQEWKVHLQTQEQLDYDVSRNGWAGYYPDPSAFLEVFTSTSNVNQTGWTNPKYDQAFKEANQMEAGAERRKKLKEAEKILLEDSPLAPIYTYSNFGFLRPQVKGFVANKVDRPFIRYLYKTSGP